MPNPMSMPRTLRALPLVLILACAPGVTDNNKIAATFAANTSPANNAAVASVASPAPSVLVTNNGGHPVQGVDVTFAVTAGNGSVTAASVQTDSKGIATVGSWTYGPLVGANQLTATVVGVSGKSVIFNVTTKAAAAAAVTKINDGQAAPVGEALPQPVAVVVKDAYGNVVSGATVSFSASVGSVNPTSAQTDATGKAQTQWTMGATPGSASLTASIPAIASPVAFAATATPAPAASVTKSNDGQVGTVGTALASPATVTVKDKYGNPVSGVVVAFAAAGNGSASPTSAMTDAQGVASTQWTLPTVAGQASLSATAGSLPAVSFSATANPGAPASLVASSYPSSGTVFTSPADSVSVTLTDSYGNAISGASVGFAASGNGLVSPASAATSASGVAKAKWTLPKTAGAASLVASIGGLSTTFNVTAVAGPPATMTASGSGQSGTVHTALANPAVVTVKDAYGNLVGGATVSFTPSGNGSASPVSASTNQAGQASTSWTLPTAAGSATLGATAGNASTLLSATAVADAPAQITKGNGDGQTANAGSTLPQSLVVVVRDQYGNSISGASVVFTPDAGSVSPSSTTTDFTGQAATSWTLGANGGTQSVTVNSGNASAATFTATAIAVNTDPCASKGTLGVGSDVTGDLSKSQCAYDGRGAMADVWTLNLTGSGPVDIRYQADDQVNFDTYLTMYRGQYSGLSNIVAFNDDNGYYDDGTNSGVRLLGGTGQFSLGATQFSTTAGTYHLSVAGWNGDMSGCAEGIFALSGTNTNQTLTNTDCARPTAARWADKAYIYLKAGETITLGMSSSTFDAKVDLVALVNGAWTTVATDDNSAGGTDARLVYTATKTDFYTIYPTAARDNSGGAYNLTVSVASSAPSPTRTLTTSTTSGTLSRTSSPTLPSSGTVSRQTVDAYLSRQKTSLK